LQYLAKRVEWAQGRHHCSTITHFCLYLEKSAREKKGRLIDKPSEKPDKKEAKSSAERVIRGNEKFNVPLQTEEEEAETFENAEVEHLADGSEIRRKKRE
jgi:hypothetical protein